MEKKSGKQREEDRAQSSKFKSKLEVKREIEMERTLGRVAELENSRNKVYTWGVIIDSTEPFKVKEELKWTQKIKIIDQTFNFHTVIINQDIRFQNFIYIYIYGDKVEDLPKIVNIGDIIRLRRFNFSINEKGELVGHMQKYSNWMTFSITDSPLSFSIQSSCNNYQEQNSKRQIEPYEKEKLATLRIWIHEFFSQNSVRSITWWTKVTLPNESTDQSQYAEKDYDLILKTVKISPNMQIDFVNEEGKQFVLKLNATPVLKEQQVIKLRSVRLEYQEGQFNIMLTNRSTCLIVPPDFFDAKVFSLNFYQQNKSRIKPISPNARRRGKGDSFETRGQIIEKYPLINEYYFEDFLINKKEILTKAIPFRICSSQASLIKKQYINKMPTLLTSFRNIPKQQAEQIKHEKFVLNVFLQQVEKFQFSDYVYTYCEECQKVKKLVEVTNIECCEEILNIFVVLKLYVIDESIEENEPFPIYIVTRSQQQNPFMLWNILPEMNDYMSWANFSVQSQENFNQKLEALQKFKESMQLVVEAKQTQNNKMFLEVCDTQFLP